MADFNGKVALVTGGGSGIGRDASIGFAKGGAKVVVADYSEKGGLETVELIKGAGGDAAFVKCDVADPAQVEAAVAFSVSTYGGLHIVVNNAGIGGAAAPTGEYGIDDWKKVIDVNLNGVFYGCRYGIPAIQASGGGSVVNISSILGFAGFATSPAYVAAKHGVIGLTKAAGLEYGPLGVRVNSVHPGFIETPLLEGAGMTPGTDVYNWLASKHAMGRLGKSPEVAEVILFLASDEASFVTGSQYVVDGGYLAQ